MIEHLFLKGDVANKVWSHYCTVAGLIDNRLNLKQSIRLWRDMEDNSRSKTIFHIVPFVVIWVVRWFPPPIRWLKCNTDGASKGNPGLSSVAFCIRDHTGDLVVAIGKRIKDAPSLKAEALAIKECLEYRHRMNYKKIILETDSWSLVQILEGTWESP
ncbi:hypothetical protein R3W88_016870 [Solanum pinnatisectum]|uniref:RNase H type-1 domain-containing protein n=1 Tax=Solanum pinnatisectum TaxID=50273 RepID=A0AAV9KZR4_9SOLN|nr:hypothetical protein R3W88_016870 [Solanum pinnatisectum]